MKNLHFEYFEKCKFSTTKPYKTVELLTVDDFDASEPTSLDYTQIFPELRVLQLKGHRFLFDGKFSHLTVFEAFHISTTANFRPFFINNRQIKTLYCGSLKILHSLYQRIFDRIINYSDFVFSIVNILTIKDEFYHSFDHSKFSFGLFEQLTIDMGITHIFGNEWIDFIENLKNLKSITTTGRAIFDTNGLLNVSKVANLVQRRHQHRTTIGS